MLILVLVAILTALLSYYSWLQWASEEERRTKENILPGPKPWPIIGSLHLMANFKKYPFEVFTKLQEVYGSIFQMKLGSVNCVVVSSEKDLKEVLQTKGDHFDGRPDFRRFDLMFGGTRRNALAFCDFDKLQKIRRHILNSHTFPKGGGEMWRKLDKDCMEEMNHFMRELENLCSYGEAIVDMKGLISKACSNIFNSYFCSSGRKDYDDSKHNKYCEDFDKTFWEVNTGRAVDFLPWLLQAPWQYKKDIKDWTSSIRQYVHDNFMDQQGSGTDKNLLNCLLEKVNSDQHSKDPDSKMTEDHALYALEDVLGGHCAVSNFAVRALIDIATRPVVQEEIRKELKEVLPDGDFGLGDKTNLKYLNATFFETVRTTCSAIVPHVANRNTTIAGYKVPANTVIWINNHHMNFNNTNWTQPELYNPQRFIKDGKFQKPSHFQPFSFGKRRCMGYRITEYVTTFLLATLLDKFELKCHQEMRNQPLGQLGLAPEPFYFTLRKVDSPNRSSNVARMTA